MEHIIKKQAFNFREQSEIGRFEFIDYHGLIERKGVIAAFLPCGTNENISGMALKTENYNFIMINSDCTVGRQNFTICHEMYHLFVQEKFTSSTCNTAVFDRKDKIEYAADLFAMYLMFPEDRIYAEIDDDEFENKKISINTILMLESKLQCSHKALIYRLYELGIIDKAKWQELKELEIGKVAKENRFDNSIYKKGNDNKMIGNYEELALQAYRSGEISESRYISLLQDIFIEV